MFDKERIERIEKFVQENCWKKLPKDDRDYIKEYQNFKTEEHYKRLDIMHEEFEKQLNEVL